MVDFPADVPSIYEPKTASAAKVQWNSALLLPAAWAGRISGAEKLVKMTPAPA